MKVRCSRVVHVLESGKLVLDCGHTVVRVARKSFVLCEKCNPEAFERLRRTHARRAPINIQWTMRVG